MTLLLPIPEQQGITPRAARFTTILLIGRLSFEAGDNLCRVRDISTGGMRVETIAPVHIGQRVDVELKNGMIVHSTVVWVGNAEAGVRFEAPIDIDQLLAAPERAKGAAGVRTMRSPRLAARCPVVLRHQGRILSAALTDVSQGGAQLQVKEPIKGADPVVLIIPGLGSLHATTRWARQDSIGVSFTERLGFADLAQWLAGEDRFALAPAADVSPIPQNS